MAKLKLELTTHVVVVEESSVAVSWRRSALVAVVLHYCRLFFAQRVRSFV